MELSNQGLGKTVIYEDGRKETVLAATDAKVRHASIFIRQDRLREDGPWMVKFGHVPLWRNYDLVSVGIVHYDTEKKMFTSLLYLPEGITSAQHVTLAELRKFIERSLSSGMISREDMIEFIPSLV